MLRLADLIDATNARIGDAVRWCALAMALLQFTLVLLRYVFGVSYVWATESVLYLHAALFMLGAGYTLLVDGHVRVDIFYAKMSARGRALVDLGGALSLLGPSMAALLWWSWPSVRRSWAMLEGSISVGGLPASFLLKTLIPAFCVLLLLQGLSLAIRSLHRLTSSDA
jgi:TRAP-type mannitol/chloroaromatic compound transport system permease small subunit